MYDFISAATIQGLTKKMAKGFKIIHIRLLLITGTYNNYHNIFWYNNDKKWLS